MGASADDILTAATRFIPPQQGLFTETATVADTASVAIATGVATTGEGWYSFACNAAFTITFNVDGKAADATPTLTAPTNTETMQAGVHSWWLSKWNTCFKITATESGYVRHWKSSQTNA